jgi:hypothetical protein
MKVVMLRVGIDAGCGGIQGPLFQDRTFEFIPIPEDDQSTMNVLEKQTYGNTKGKYGRLFKDFFRKSCQSRMEDRPVHADPEFETYTYGDPAKLKSSLRLLEEGDMLIFYCGLEGWGFKCDPALYLMGYFDVLKAGLATDLESDTIDNLFGKNSHVMNKNLFNEQKDRLVLVKGSNKSRLLKKAVLISTMDQDKAGRPIKILSPEMRKTFGNFDGHLAIQRSPPRWVEPAFVDSAAEFMRELD